MALPLFNQQAKRLDQVVAIDLRGYNKSDQPEGVENYTMDKLTSDVAAVVKHFKQEKATIVGHDWGAPVAWNAALLRPDRFRAVAALSVPYPQRGPVAPTTPVVP